MLLYTATTAFPMAEHEQKLAQQAQAEIQPLSLPVTIQDNEHTIAIWKSETGLTVMIEGQEIDLTIGFKTPTGEQFALSLNRRSPTETTPTKLSPYAPEQEKVHLEGFIGRTPTYRPHKESGLVFIFPLGVHPQKGETLWYDVLAPDEKAKAYQHAFEKGARVQLTGSEHTYQGQKRDGSEKTVRQFYVDEITKVQPKTTKDTR